MGQLYFNNAHAELSASIDDSTTAIVITNSVGLPAVLAADDWFLLTVFTRSGLHGENIEIVRVDDTDGTNLVVVRGQEDTDAVEHTAGDPIEARFTAGTLNTVRDGGGVTSLPVFVDAAAAGVVELDFSQFSVFEITAAADITLSAVGLGGDSRSAGAVFVDNTGNYAVATTGFVTGPGFLGFVGTFDLSVAALFDLPSFYVGGQLPVPTGIAFSADGTKMFVSDSNTDSIHQYSLTEGFDATTASYDAVSLDISSQDAVPREIAFSPDGTKMFMVGNNLDLVHQYSLTSGFDLTTASYDSVSLDVSGQDTAPSGLAFSPDGTKMYVAGLASRAVYQYSLTSGFDLTTASYDSVSLDVSGQENSPNGIAFSPDGTKMYVVGSSSDSVYQYSLTSGFDLTTASYDAVSLDVSGQEAFPNSVAVSPDGTKMYVIGNGADSVLQYTIGANFIWLDCYQRGLSMVATGEIL